MMSDKQSIMKFEFLPNEILLECFQYFDACEIFHSFDQLNNRFNQLIRHIPLCIDFQNINKSIFDEFCTKMLLNPTIKNQIYSLYLPNDDRCFQTNAFWSHFSFNEFPNLQTYISTISLLPDLMYNSLLIKPPNAKIKTLDLIFSNLRTLSILTLDFTSPNTHQTSFITNLTLSECGFKQFDQLLTYTPMLKYLYINSMYSEQFDTTFSSDEERCYVYLNKLILENFSGTFNQFELLVKRTPNLKWLLISTSKQVDMIDGDRWKQLIRSSLSHLTVFKFIFDNLAHSRMPDIMAKFQQFQTNFWQNEHHWFVEMILAGNLTSIFTIPYFKNAFKIPPNGKRYQNNSINHIDTFANVTYLTLYTEAVTGNCQDYFPSVTNLRLIPNDDMPVTEKHVEYLKKIINLLNLKHLDISYYNKMLIPASIFLTLIKEAQQLSSLKIDWNLLASFFIGNDLCNYQNKMIKVLHICDNNSHLIDDYFDVEKFCQIFSNVEHLKYEYGHANQLLFSLNRLSKLSTIAANWKTDENPEENRLRFELEAKKLNSIYEMNTKWFSMQTSLFYNDSDKISDPTGLYFIDLRVWFRNNPSE
jgi:hypothetical protein